MVARIVRLRSHHDPECCLMGVRGPQRTEGALRRTGWRPPYIQEQYQDLVFKIFERPEFDKASSREVLEAALKAFATEDELSQVDLPD